MNQNETNPTVLKIFDALNQAGHNLSADRLNDLKLSDQSFDLSNSNEGLSANFFKYSPGSFDDLKLFLGVPNDAINHENNGVELKPVNLEELPKGVGSSNTAEWTDEEKNAVENMAYNLLQGSTEGLDLTQSPYTEVVQHLMNQYGTIDVLAASDLNVADGTEYKISTATAVFNTVTIHGSGQIVLGVPNCKITANTIRYVI